MKVKTRYFFLAAALTLSLSACGPQSPGGSGGEKIYLTVRTGEEGGPLDLAGSAIADAVNNTVTGAVVKSEPSKGSTVNVLNIQEGDVGLGLVYGDLASDAYLGAGAYEGNRKEKLRAIGACFTVGSLWMVREDSGLTRVNELPGMILAAGSRASKTSTASGLAFKALGIDGENTELWNLSREEGRACLEEASVDAAHEFRVIEAEERFRVLTYEDKEIREIIEDKPSWIWIDIPAGTFPLQTEQVSTFGTKIVLCASADMEEELAYEIAKAMDLKVGDMAEEYEPMEAMEKKEFLYEELPVPLHPGAERYYREAGYLTAKPGQTRG